MAIRQWLGMIKDDSKHLSSRTSAFGQEDSLYSGTSIVAEPCAAFSALKIQTSPPTAPTIKDTAPNSSETLMPSFVISPAYPNARPIVPSRTPQPAIEIRSMVISITGGISWKIWPNVTGAPIDCTTHHAMKTARTWTSTDRTAIFGPRSLLKITRLAIAEQAYKWWVPHQRFSHGQCNLPRIRNPIPPARAAKSTTSSADRPWGSPISL